MAAGFKPTDAPKIAQGNAAGEGSSEPRPLRADARRNREALIAVAGQRFAQEGATASLDQIARDAGVGIGTLYRHFPTREHLVEAVYRREVDQLCASAPALLAQHAPAEALALWMQNFVSYAATKRGLKESLRDMMSTREGLFTDAGARMRAAAGSLLQAGTAAGTVRDDISVEDLLLALSGIFGAPDTPDWQDRSRRLARLIFDGLRRLD